MIRQRRLRQDRRGVASLEFVMVAPVLISLAVGMTEMVRYVRAKSALTVAATAMADLVASMPGVSPPQLQDLCVGSTYIVAPLPASSLAMSVNSYTYPLGTTAPIARDWQNNAPCPTVAATPNASALLSTASGMLVNRGDSVIAVQASYTYTPMVSTLFATTTFQQTVYARPRFGAVLCPTC